MKDLIAKLLNSQEGILTIVIMTVICMNIVLTAAKKVLSRIKDKTESKTDDKAYEVITKVLSALNKVLEFASANSDALPPKVKAELAKQDWTEEEKAEVKAAIEKSQEVTSEMSPSKEDA